MLPDANDSPTKGAQLAEIAPITLPIGPEFLLPERGQLVFPGGQPPAMPEVTIYEDRNLLLCEYDIG